MGKTKNITLDSIVKKSEHLLTGKIDEEMVMMSFKNNEYYGMNKAGSRIWQIIEEPTHVKSIILALVREYDVDITECQKDVVEFLTLLFSKNLITIN